MITFVVWMVMFISLAPVRAGWRRCMLWRRIMTKSRASRQLPRRIFIDNFLEQAIAELATALLQIQSKSTRITSFYGVYDQVIPPNNSHLDNIHSVKRLIGSRIANITHEQLPTIGHGLTIATGLTIFGGRIRKSFR